MFYLRAVLHEDLLFRSLQWSLTGLDVAWDGCSASPAVSMQCSLPVVVTHCCFPLSLCLRSKRMRCHGFTRMRMGMWGVSMVRISGIPHYTTWLEKTTTPLCRILWDYQVPKVNHYSMFNLQQEEFLHRASGMTVKHPHPRLLLSYWLISWCSLTCRNKVPKRIKMWWVHFSFTSSGLQKCHIDLLSNTNGNSI